MTDAPPPVDERRRTDSKAADKGAGDGGGGEQDEVTRLHVGRLTRNVKEEHVREIFSTFGKLKVSGVIYHSCRSRSCSAALASLQWHLPEEIAQPSLAIVVQLRGECVGNISRPLMSTGSHLV